MKNIKFLYLGLITVGLLLLAGCELGQNNTPNLEESLELYAGLEIVPEAQNSMLIINKGRDLSEDGYFKVNVSNVLPNDLIENVEVEAWCLEWKKPLRSNGDVHENIKWFSTSTNDNWKPINYLFSIRNELFDTYEDLTFLEIQAVVWTLAGHIGIAPEFNIDKLRVDELPSDLRDGGELVVNPDYIREITERVLTEYSTSTFTVGGFALQTASNEQDIFVPEDPDPEPEKEVVRIVLTPEQGEVKVSETLQLTATFFDADDNEIECADPVWSSDDELIATVGSNGEVFGENQGSANITVECNGVTASSTITVDREDIQTPGRDIIVFNDINPFDNTRLQNPNNVSFVKNLVNFTTTGPRNDGDTVMWDCGRNTVFNGCTNFAISGSRSIIQNEGFILSTIQSASGSLVDIPSNVKALWLWLPTVPYTVDEINALKQFAAEGGRIVFIGEWDQFYGVQGLAVENQLLINLGAVMRNVGNALDCGSVLLPEASIREHPVTAGITNLTIACASIIELGPDDLPLFYDSTNTYVLAGVAKINTVPITELQKTVSKMVISRSGNTLSTTGE